MIEHGAPHSQDFDEKRREWRRTKKNVINAISEMSARALKFECSEKKTIALHAIQFYKVCFNYVDKLFRWLVSTSSSQETQ